MMRLVLTLLVAFSLSSQAMVNYSERQDDFSNDTVRTLKVGTDDEGLSILMMSCFPSGSLEVQIYTKETIFPNDSNGDAMSVNVLHKFRSESPAATTDWHMNIMKYNNAWYEGDARAFIEDAMKATGLNVKFTKRGQIYRYDFEDSAQHMKKLLDNCPA